MLPRLLTGLDACVLSRQSIDKMEDWYRKLLRMTQGLPENTARCAVYLLVGSLPLEGYIHLRMLSLFGNVSRLERNSPLYQLALRHTHRHAQL